MNFIDTNVSRCMFEIGFRIFTCKYCCVEYIKNGLIIGIVVNNYSYDIDTYVMLENDSNRLLLQTVLDYFEIVEFRGRYQFPSLNKTNSGVDYILRSVREVALRFEKSPVSIFKEIIIWCEDLAKKNLGSYAFLKDMEQAEKYWQEKEYEKAKELYSKNKEKLSDRQMKKLEYITKKLR